MNSTLNKVDDALMHCILEQTGLAFGLEPEAIRGKQVGNAALVTAVSIMAETEIDDPTIANFFSEDQTWLKRLKNEIPAVRKDQRYLVASNNSREELLTLSALSGFSSEASRSDESSSSGETKEVQAVARPILNGSKETSDPFEAVLEAVAKVTGIDTESIRTGTDRSSSRARAIAMKADLLVGISCETIAARFSKGKAAVYSAVKKLKSEEVKSAETIARVIQTKSLGTEIALTLPEKKKNLAPQSLRIPALAGGEKGRRKSEKALEEMEERVCAVFIGRGLLTSSDPIAEVNMAKEVLVYLAALGMDPDEVCAALKITEDEMYKSVGKTAIKAARDPLFAKKIRHLQKE